MNAVMNQILCLELLFMFRNCWVSFFSLDTGYPGWGFSWFFTVLQFRCWDTVVK